MEYMEAFKIGDGGGDMWNRKNQGSDVESIEAFLRDRSKGSREVVIKNEAYADVPKELISNPNISEIGLVFYDEGSTLNDGAEMSKRKVRLEVGFKNTEGHRTYTFVLPEDLIKIPIQAMTEISGEENPVLGYQKFYPIKELILESDKKINKSLA